MSNRSVVVLVIVALSLAVAVLVFERQISQEVRPSTDEYKVFKAYGADQVESVSLLNGELAVKLVREADGWQQISPVTAAADKIKVEKLLEQIGKLKEVGAPIKAGPGKTINMGTYGLDEPSRKIIISYGGVQEATLSLGHRTESAEQLYARLGKENRVMIIEANISEPLEEIAADKNTYRSRKVFQGQHIDKALEIQVLTSDSQQDKPIVLQKSQTGGRWALLGPIEDRADQEKVEKILAQCTALETAEFIELSSNRVEFAEALKTYGLTGEEKTEVVALAAEGMQKVLLYIGGPDAQKKFRYGLVEREAVLARSQEIVKIPAEFVKVLPESAEVLRDKKFLRFDNQKITEVLLDSAAGETVLSQDQTKGQWVIKGNEAAADKEIVGEFLGELKGLTATGFAGEVTADMGFEEPFLSVRIKTDQQNPDNTLQLGTAKDRQYRYARLGSDKTVRLVSEEAANNLVHDRLYFYERKLAQINRWETKECTVTIGQEQKQAAQKDEQWWLTEPINARAEEDAVRQAIGIMDPLRAERIVADNVADGNQALAEYGLDEPRYKLTVVKEIKKDNEEIQNEPPVEPGAKYKKEEYILMVGKAADAEGKEYYGRLKGKGLVFVISKEAIGKLEGDWRSKRVWPIISWQVNQLSKVEITRGSEVLSLEKPRENWQVVSPKKFWPNQAEVEKMLEALGNLEAVEFGPDEPDEPRMVVKAVLQKPETSEPEEYRFVVGKLIEGKGYAVKTDGEDVVRLVAAEKLEPLKVDYLRLREKKILGFEAKEIRAIEISEKNKTKYKAQRVESGWQLTAPAGKTVQIDNLENMLKTLGNLQAREIVTDTLDEANKYGLDEPYMAVTVEMDQNKTHTLLIGDEIKTQDKEKTKPRYAVLEGDTTVFVISGEDVEVLEKELAF